MLAENVRATGAKITFFIYPRVELISIHSVSFDKLTSCRAASPPTTDGRPRFGQGVCLCSSKRFDAEKQRGGGLLNLKVKVLVFLDHVNSKAPRAISSVQYSCKQLFEIVHVNRCDRGGVLNNLFARSHRCRTVCHFKKSSSLPCSNQAEVCQRLLNRRAENIP